MIHVFLRLYKNKIDESPGWNDEVLRWCMEAAQENDLRREDYWGGFVIDEMKIQVCCCKVSTWKWQQHVQCDQTFPKAICDNEL